MVHSKVKMLLFFIHRHIKIRFFTLIVLWPYNGKKMGSAVLPNSILQNIFCILQKNESHTGLV